MVLNLSLLVSHRTFVIILVKWWILIKTLALKASISFFAVLLHSACAQERFWGRSNDLYKLLLKQHYGCHYSWNTSIKLWTGTGTICAVTIWTSNLQVYPLICSFWSDNQFYYKFNIYIWVTYAFFSINIISYGCFLLFIDIPPSTTQAYLSYWLSWM